MLNKTLLHLYLLPLAAYAASLFDKATLDELDDIIHGKSYDARLRPGGEEPLTVSLSGYILQLDEVDLAKSEITLSMYLRQFWTDERLKISKKVVINDIAGLWHPDTFIVNEKKMAATAEEQFVRILPTGEVLYSRRVTAKFRCVLDEENIWVHSS